MTAPKLLPILPRPTEVYITLTRYTLEELIDRIDEDRRPAYQHILADYGDLFRTAPGSNKNHHAWPGGYWDHVTEVMNIAVLLYPALDSARPLDFPLSEALEVLFLHDIEKPWRYNLVDGRLEINPELTGKPERKAFREAKLAEYGIRLNRRQTNALKYVEGELDDYSPDHRVMWPLAEFCHICDGASARLWPEHPFPAEDPWPGASRISELAGKPGLRFSAYRDRVCPGCGSSSECRELKDYDPMWQDGRIYCTVCGAFVRCYDAG